MDPAGPQAGRRHRPGRAGRGRRPAQLRLAGRQASTTPPLRPAGRAGPADAGPRPVGARGGRRDDRPCGNGARRPGHRVRPGPQARSGWAIGGGARRTGDAYRLPPDPLHVDPLQSQVAISSQLFLDRGPEAPAALLDYDHLTHWPRTRPTPVRECARSHRSAPTGTASTPGSTPAPPCCRPGACSVPRSGTPCRAAARPGGLPDHGTGLAGRERSRWDGGAFIAACHGQGRRGAPWQPTERVELDDTWSACSGRPRATPTPCPHFGCAGRWDCGSACSAYGSHRSRGRGCRRSDAPPRPKPRSRPRPPRAGPRRTPRPSDERACSGPATSTGSTSTWPGRASLPRGDKGTKEPYLTQPLTPVDIRSFWFRTAPAQDDSSPPRPQRTVSASRAPPSASVRLRPRDAGALPPRLRTGAERAAPLRPRRRASVASPPATSRLWRALRLRPRLLAPSPRPGQPRGPGPAAHRHLRGPDQRGTPAGAVRGHWPRPTWPRLRSRSRRAGPAGRRLRLAAESWYEVSPSPPARAWTADDSRGQLSGRRGGRTARADGRHRVPCRPTATPPAGGTGAGDRALGRTSLDDDGRLRRSSTASGSTAGRPQRTRGPVCCGSRTLRSGAAPESWSSHRSRSTAPVASRSPGSSSGMLGRPVPFDVTCATAAARACCSRPAPRSSPSGSAGIQDAAHPAAAPDLPGPADDARRHPPGVARDAAAPKLRRGGVMPSWSCPPWLLAASAVTADGEPDPDLPDRTHCASCRRHLWVPAGAVPAVGPRCRRSRSARLVTAATPADRQRRPRRRGWTADRLAGTRSPFEWAAWPARGALSRR